MDSFPSAVFANCWVVWKSCRWPSAGLAKSQKTLANACGRQECCRKRDIGNSRFRGLDLAVGRPYLWWFPGLRSTSLFQKLGSSCATRLVKRTLWYTKWLDIVRHFTMVFELWFSNVKCGVMESIILQNIPGLTPATRTFFG